MAISESEVAKHGTRYSCWVVVEGNVYDVTDFLEGHPGGVSSILKYAGKDATEEYNMFHSKGTIERSLPQDKQLGPVDMSRAKKMAMAAPARPGGGQQPEAKKEQIPLCLCLSLNDIEAAAEIAIPKPAWTYFHSASDGLGSLRNNQQDWKRVTFRPRVMRDVKRVDLRRMMLGHASSLPFFIAPAARATLVHPDGELCLVRGAARAGIPYCPSTFSSFPHAELAECLGFENSQDGQGCMFFQLYVAKEKKRTIELVTMARKLGFKALLITVDTAVVGKREEDEKYRAEQDYLAGRSDGALVDWQRRSESLEEDVPVLRGHASSTLNWDDLPWIREAWGADTGPVVLKGIQTVEDAVMAVQAGVDAIYLSNHGGRQCDDAPSSLRVLLEIHRFHPQILGKVEIYLDGSVRRGADILKAIALGATGVAIGRPFMYSLQYGTEGVLKAIQILSEEIETTMRLIGVTSLEQLNPSYVNTAALERELPLHLIFAVGNGRRESKL